MKNRRCLFRRVRHAAEPGVREVCQRIFSTNERTKKTRAAYRSDLTQFVVFAGEDLPLKSLSGALVERWCAHLRQRGYAPTSIRRKMVVLRVFCSYRVRRGSLRESPFWRVKLSYGRAEQLPRARSAPERRG